MNDFKRGLIYNYASVIILAISGLLFNTIIVLFFDTNILGVFNQVFAYYTVFSQIAVFGIHSAIVKIASEHPEDRMKSASLCFTSILTSLGISLIVSIIVFGLIYGIDKFFNWELAISLFPVIPALVFFSINKVILGYINALEQMRAYAIFQSMRNILIIISIILIFILKINPVYIGLCFTFAEVVLFLVCTAYLILSKTINTNFSLIDAKNLVTFGIKIIPSNLLLNLNMKVDIICLGWILNNNEIIGIYSFAILFADGFYQLFVVVRRSINPKISLIHTSNDYNFSEKFKEISVLAKKYTKMLAMPLAVLVIIGYLLLCLILQRHEYLYMALPLSIIIVAMAMNSKMIILGNSLSQCGFPTLESKVNIISVSSNFALNLVSIHFLGVYGAAIATAGSYFVLGISLRYYMNKVLI